ncbi:phage terminase large subunit family protein [Albimonas pacifica]|uniref:Phage terminase, large subunit GpA n=1 Tax=Albimonas pacifica TaxID=1114924 RepID=A0A1I3FAU6_9RHOB|nr:phage terminase large subunit family protein [Albimonas pacifica]SFI08353.1 Phage terminase, large subunit GpA [Albimonas pacifica]
MTTDAALIDAAWRAGMMPERQLTVSEWADAHRMLPATSAEPGRWRTDRAPYLRGIMDALSVGSPLERVVFVKGAQLGGTEAGLNWLGYIVHNAPGLALLVMPSLDMVRRNTRTRIDPMIEATPELRKRIAPARSRDSTNTAFAKAFPGGQIVMTGANSAAGLRSTPARFLFMDEVDAFPADADGEGDPVDLAMKRTATYRGRRKVLLVSTPTIKGESRIEAAFLESDQRRFFIPCPACGEFQTLEWGNIHWPQGRRREAYACCQHCGGVIEDEQKPELLARGEWRATAEGDGRTAGFHLSSLYSVFESFGEIAEWHGKVRKDPARLQVWVNTALGETWEDQGGEMIDPGGLLARREAFGDEVPADVVLLTAGVDVQADRIEAQVVGWGAGEQSFVLEHVIIWGDPSGPAIWEALDAFLLERRPHARAVPDMGLRAVCVDTGGLNTAMAYEFVRPRLRRRVWGIKGRGGQGVQAWPRAASKGKGGAPVFIVGVDALKDKIAARLPIAEPGPGAIRFAAGLGPEWFDQLTAEKVRTRYVNGRPVRSWEPKRSGIRNEALDCLVYASAALHGLRVQGLDLEREAQEISNVALKAAGRAAPAPAARPTRIKSKWMER